MNEYPLQLIPGVYLIQFQPWCIRKVIKLNNLYNIDIYTIPQIISKFLMRNIFYNNIHIIDFSQTQKKQLFLTLAEFEDQNH